MAGRSSLLSLSGASKVFGAVVALDDVSLEVEAGEIVALVGDNGAGKSTLVKGLAGVQPFDTAQLLIKGQQAHVSHPDDAAALGIATVYQDLALCDNLDVVANLFLGREIRSRGSAAFTRSLDEKSMERRATELLSNLAVSITDVRLLVGQMSGGQRQQVAVARSMLGDPSIVLLDEPTAALGVAQTAQVLDLLRRLRDRGLGVILISHNLADVFSVADRVVVLRLGRNTHDLPIAQTSRDEVVAAITGAKEADVS